MREKYLPNKIFNSLNETNEKVIYGLNDLSSKQDYVESITNFSYLNIVL